MPRIERLFAYVISDSGPEDEGVPAMSVGALQFPLMGADLGRVASLERAAQRAADMAGKPVELRVFSNVETVRVILPQGTH